MKHFIQTACILFLVVFLSLFARVKPVFAGGCVCATSKAILVSFSIPICVNRLESTTTSCNPADAIPSCACGDNPDCGYNGQPACNILPSELVNGAVSFDEFLAWHAKNSNAGIPAWIFQAAANQGSSNNVCKNAGESSFNTSVGAICAASQTEADIFAKAQQQAQAGTTPIKPFNLCVQAGDKSPDCEKCLLGKKGIWTAIGCVPTSREGITNSFAMLGLGVSGVAVLLATLGASLKLALSKGDPKGVDESREWITSIVGGILFILFSVVLLNTIGVKLLQIPGF